MKTITHLKLYALLGVMFLSFATLQGLSASNNEWRFTTYTTSDGLSNDYIRTLALDGDGFLWIGTINGLNRYDGYTFKQYGTIQSENKSVPVPAIKCIFLTKDNELLIGTQKGVLKYDKNQDKIVNYELCNAIADKAIRTINENDYGLWVGTNYGLYKINKQEDKCKLYNVKNSGICNNKVQAIHFEDKEIWIGTFDGISIMNIESGKTYKLPITSHYNFGIKNNFVECFSKSPFNSNKVFAGTQTGLYEIDRYSKEVKHISSLSNPEIKNNSIKSIKVADNEMFCTTEEGFLIYNGSTFKSIVYDYTDLYGLPNNIVWDILPINKEVMWVATQQGLARSSKIISSNQFYPFQNFKNFNNNGMQVLAAHQTEKDKVWIGSQYGLSLIDFRNGSMSAVLGDLPKLGIHKPIRAIATDKNGMMWLGLSEGLKYYNPISKKEVVLPEQVSNRLKFIHSVVVDESGVYASDFDGKLQLIQYSYNKNENKISITKNAVIDLNMPTALLTISRQSLWLSCRGYGLIRYDLKTNKHYKYSASDKTSGLTSNRINIINVDRNKVLWAGFDDALQYYNAKTNSFEVALKYPTVRNIFSLQSDSNSIIWFSTLDGISKYNPKTGNLSRYTPLQWRERREKAITSTLCDTNNNIYFFGIDGYFKFSSTNFETVSNSKKMFLSDVFVDGVSDSEAAEIQNDGNGKVKIAVTGKKSIELHFTTLDYAAPELIHYIYKIENADWQGLNSGQNKLLLDKLSYGKNTVQVKSVDSESVESEFNLEIELDIIRPWWIKWWMILTYIIVAITAGWQVYSLIKYRYRMARTLKKERDENERKQMIMDLKQRLFTNISHDFKTPLSLIISPVETLLDTVKDNANQERLKTIRDNAQRLLRLVNQTIDIKKIENELLQLNRESANLSSLIDSVIFTFSEYAKTKGITLTFENESKNLTFDFDLDKIEKVVYNLISNAIKFSNQGAHVIVTLRTSDLMECKIIVSDTGIGIADKDIPFIFERYYQSEVSRANMTGSGIGLTIVKEYVELHGGAISVTSKENTGSTFCVSLPIINLNHTDDSSSHLAVLQSDKPTLLIVEDNQELGNYLTSELMDRFTVVVEKTAENGIKKATELLPQLIILDVMLPGISGLEACKILKTEFVTSHIPIIIYSAKNSEETRAQSYEFQADAFLQKPFTLKVLLSMVDNILQRQKKQIEENNQIDIVRKIKDPSPNERFLQKVLDLVEKNIANSDLDAQFICTKLGMSYITFYRKMLSLTGDSINTYIRNIRIQKAADLMHQDGFNVSDIMYEVGFNNRSYFSLCFKEVYGVTPKQYINDHKKKNNEDEVN